MLMLCMQDMHEPGLCCHRQNKQAKPEPMQAGPLILLCSLHQGPSLRCKFLTIYCCLAPNLKCNIRLLANGGYGSTVFETIDAMHLEIKQSKFTQSFL